MCCKYPQQYSGVTGDDHDRDAGGGGDNDDDVDDEGSALTFYATRG